MTRHLIGGLVLAAAVVAVASAQARRSGDPDPAGADRLLTEVRALRAELNQVAALGIRTQLLVGRLQLQESRIHTIDRELTETRQQLAEIVRGRAMMAGPLKMLGHDEPGAADDPEAAGIFAPLKQMVAAQQTREQELRDREATLASTLAAEQARWTEFSRQLDDIERNLARR